MNILNINLELNATEFRKKINEKQIEIVEHRTRDARIYRNGRNVTEEDLRSSLKNNLF